MDYQRCLENAKAPKMAPGERIVEGKFARSLEEDGATKRFDLDKEPPEFGYRVKPHEWRWTSQEEDDGLSVNLDDCICAPLCSILFHQHPDRFQHVVVIDLAALAQELKIGIVAVYDPDPDGFKNPCHFNLLPTDVTVEQLVISLKIWAKTNFAPNRKVPRETKTIELAHTQRRQYERVFVVSRNVREVSPSVPRIPATEPVEALPSATPLQAE